MLVLTRKETESIRIGDDIVITITHIQGSRVRFGIDAPKDVRILRGELTAMLPSMPVVESPVDTR